MLIPVRLSATPQRQTWCVWAHTHIYTHIHMQTKRTGGYGSVKRSKMLYIQIYFIKRSNTSRSFHWLYYLFCMLTFFPQVLPQSSCKHELGGLKSGPWTIKMCWLSSLWTHTPCSVPYVHSLFTCCLRQAEAIKILLGFKIWSCCEELLSSSDTDSIPMMSLADSSSPRAPKLCRCVQEKVAQTHISSLLLLSEEFDLCLYRLVMSQLLYFVERLRDSDIRAGSQNAEARPANPNCHRYRRSRQFRRTSGNFHHKDAQRCVHDISKVSRVAWCPTGACCGGLVSVHLQPLTGNGYPGNSSQGAAFFSLCPLTSMARTTSLFPVVSHAGVYHLPAQPSTPHSDYVLLECRWKKLLLPSYADVYHFPQKWLQ